MKHLIRLRNKIKYKIDNLGFEDMIIIGLYGGIAFFAIVIFVIGFLVGKFLGR